MIHLLFQETWYILKKPIIPRDTPPPPHFGRQRANLQTGLQDLLLNLGKAGRGHGGWGGKINVIVEGLSWECKNGKALLVLQNSTNPKHPPPLRPPTFRFPARFDRRWEPDSLDLWSRSRGLRADRKVGLTGKLRIALACSFVGQCGNTASATTQHCVSASQEDLVVFSLRRGWNGKFMKQKSPKSTLQNTRVDNNKKMARDNTACCHLWYYFCCPYLKSTPFWGKQAKYREILSFFRRKW